MFVFESDHSGVVDLSAAGPNTGLMFSGYDSDVAREKVVDYVTKIYSASIRNMSGTRPHLQHKELPVEERYYDKNLSEVPYCTDVT